MALTDNSYKYIFAVKIYLGAGTYEDNANGFYLDSGNVYIKLIEAQPESGLSEAFQEDLGLEVGEIAASLDLRRAGAVEEIGGTEVSWDNTGNGGTPISQIVASEALVVAGKKIEIIRMTLNGSGAVTAETVIYTGVTQDPVYTETTVSVAVDSPAAGRDALLAKRVNTTDHPDASSKTIGKIIPLTFGEFSGYENTIEEFSGFAMLIKVDDLDQEYWNTDVPPRDVADGIIPETNIFAITESDGAVPTLQYYIRLNRTMVADQGLDASYFIGKYLFVVEGKSGNDFRLITDASDSLDTYASGRAHTLFVTIADYFTETLIGDNEGLPSDPNDQTWVKFIDIEQSYVSDVWPCIGFLDENAEEVTSGVDIFAYTEKATYDDSEEFEIQYSSEIFRQIPKYAYSVIDSDKCGIQIDMKQFKGSKDNAESIFGMAPLDVSFVVDTSTIVALGYTGYHLHHPEYNEFVFSEDSVPAVAYGDVVSGSTTDTYDKDSTTYLEIRHHETAYIDAVTFDSVISLRVAPPDFETIPDFDELYLLVDADFIHDGTAPDATFTWDISWRRFIGSTTSIYDKNDTIAYDGTWYMASVPDFYYEDGPSTNNKNYYVSIDAEPEGSDERTSGHRLFKIVGITKDNYKSLYECFITMRFQHAPAVPEYIWGYDDHIKIREIAFAFKKKMTVGDAVYGRFGGRIIDDTWGLRKTEKDMIANPVDAIEHVCRLQNWNDGTAAGTAYSAKALINTAASEGGFDYSRLDGIKGMDFAGQVLNDGDAWSAAMKESICREFFLASFVTHAGADSGKECLSNIVESYIENGISITDTITLASIVGDPGAVEDIGANDIYPEPQMKYMKNYATGEYEGFISVTNATASSYSSDYVTGLPSDLKELAWMYCRELYLLSGKIVAPPTDLIECNWIRTYDTAVDRFFRWLKWMGAGTTTGTPAGAFAELKKRILISVPYGVAADWQLCRHVYLNLPHQTAGVDRECIIESIRHDLDAGVTELGLIMFGANVATISSSSSQSSSSTSSSSQSSSSSESSSSESSSSESSSSGSSPSSESSSTEASESSSSSSQSASSQSSSSISSSSSESSSSESSSSESSSSGSSPSSESSSTEASESSSSSSQSASSQSSSSISSSSSEEDDDWVDTYGVGGGTDIVDSYHTQAEAPTNAADAVDTYE